MTLSDLTFTGQSSTDRRREARMIAERSSEKKRISGDRLCLPSPRIALTLWLRGVLIEARQLFGAVISERQVFDGYPGPPHPLGSR